MKKECRECKRVKEYDFFHKNRSIKDGYSPLCKNGMTWGKFLDGKIHIDHIKPMSSFNLHNENELKRCMHHTNLQPLWARDNIRKGNKIIK